MCEIVKTCHEQGIVLRDLKLRKFVFADKERWVGSAAISAQMLTSALSIRTRSYLMCFARNRAFRRVDVENPLLFRFAKNPHCFLKLIPTWAASEMLFRVLARLLACFFFSSLFFRHWKIQNSAQADMLKFMKTNTAAAAREWKIHVNSTKRLVALLISA